MKIGAKTKPVRDILGNYGCITLTIDSSVVRTRFHLFLLYDFAVHKGS